VAIINTGLLTKGLRSEFYAKFNAVPTFFQDLTTRYPSTTDLERHRWLGQLPPMREWGQGRLARGLNTESYSVENLKYESTLEVDRDEVDDDQSGQIRMRIGEMAIAAASHKDYLLSLLLANGATSGYDSYDGVSFFNDAHVSGASGEQDNDLTLSVADSSAPTVAECRAAFSQALAAMLSFKDDQGSAVRLQPRPEGLVIACPPSQLFTWHDALGLPFAASAEAGLARNILQNAAGRIIPIPELAATNFVLLKTDENIRPFIFQDRAPVEFTALERESESGFLREKYLFGVRARYRLTYGEWRFAIRTTFENAG